MSSKILAKAKAGLIVDQPFFASILLGLDIIEDSGIPTFGTDGETLRYNPEFLASLDLQEVTFVLAHEVMHCVFQHMTRRGNKNHNRWNIAGDYIINDILVTERIGRMPSGGLHDSALVKQGGGTSDGVYNLLPKETEQKGPGDQGGAMDQVTDAAQDQAGLAQKESEMRVKIVQARNAAKMTGKLSAGIDRLIKDFMRPTVDWRAILRRFLSTKAKIDLSYAKPKRRFLADDIYLPSLIGEKLGAIVVAVDCSGSINDKILAQFGAEIKVIVEDTRPSQVEVIYFDSEVLRREIFEPDQEVKLTAVGGGGTAFSPIFEALALAPIPPVACVVLTDLCCNDFGPEPEFPVLWASTDSTDAPFGEIVELKES